MRNDSADLRAAIDNVSGEIHESVHGGYSWKGQPGGAVEWTGESPINVLNGDKNKCSSLFRNIEVAYTLLRWLPRNDALKHRFAILREKLGDIETNLNELLRNLPPTTQPISYEVANKLSQTEDSLFTVSGETSDYVNLLRGTAEVTRYKK